jgi:hypothetical protein
VRVQSTLGFFGMTSEKHKIGMTGLTGGFCRRKKTGQSLGRFFMLQI